MDSKNPQDPTNINLTIFTMIQIKLSAKLYKNYNIIYQMALNKIPSLSMESKVSCIFYVESTKKYIMANILDQLKSILMEKV